MEQSYPQPPNSGYGYGGMNPGGPPPKNWLVESILVTLLCCLPFGVIGIINAANVSSKWAAGDYVGAQEASATAGKWTKIGFFVGIAQYVLVGILWMLGVGAAMMQAKSGSYN